MKGVCNVIIPSFTSDLSRLNEAAIRHDVRRNIELGFWGALLVSEAGTSRDEMLRFMEICVDEAAGRQYFVLHGTFDTADAVVKSANEAKSVGVHALLLGHPNSFYPTTAGDVLEYTEYVTSRTDLAVILFAAHQWNLERLDIRGYPLEALEQAARLDTVIAIKYEVSRPGVAGTYECFKRLANTGLLVCDPFEGNAPVWAGVFGMPWLGTGNYEFYGDSIPRMVAALNAGDHEVAMEIYWQIQPARAARFAEQATFSGSNYVHRYLWKYQAWLNGYNGGPLRQPMMKINDGQMRRMAEVLVRVGVIKGYEPFGDFYVGRCPA
jgi:4-hydroxy-tetrahydrodipicolinate synthase